MGIRHIAAALIAGLCVAASASAQTMLRVILFPGAQNLPMWVAEKKGYFQAEGLAVALSNVDEVIALIKAAPLASGVGRGVVPPAPCDS